MQEEVLARGREAWGENGRDTLRAMNNLAGTIAAQGDLAGRGRCSIGDRDAAPGIGPNDPEALTVLANLAALLWQYGDRSEAYWLQQQVVDAEAGVWRGRCRRPAPPSGSRGDAPGRHAVITAGARNRGGTLTFALSL